jgi:hypothetical protein
MEDFAKEDRGIFQGLKVPFCLNAIILAFMGYVISVAGAKCIEWATQQDAACSKVVLDLRSRLVARMPILKRPVDELIIPYALVDYKGLESANRKAGQEYIEWEQKRMEDLSALENVPAPSLRAALQEHLHEFSPAPWWMYLVLGFWFLVVWSFFAGAINRIAAYRIARDESITMREALTFAGRTWTNHFLAILFIGIFIAACFFLAALGGLICRIPYAGEIILIPGFLLVLLAAFLIALLLAGLLFGFNIISAAIGVDKVDSFDAISRSYSYVLGRPWHTLLFTLLPVLFLFFFLYFARFFLDTALFSVGYGMGDKFDVIKNYIFSGEQSALADEPTTMLICAYALRVIYLLCHFFIIAAAIAYWLSANTKAYFLLRKDVDGDEVDEMFIEEEELPLEEEEAQTKAEETAAEQTTKEQSAQEKPAQAKKPPEETSE